MQYRTDTKSGNQLSILGFGGMRFPKNVLQTDIKKTEQLILKAVEGGVNYFDTAYIYGDSETVLGQIISNNNLRDKIYIATKLPLMKCKSYVDFDALFNAQLERLKTDYIDYYLMHNLSDTAEWENLRTFGIENWIKEKKAAGKIKNIGFSFHGIHDEFIKLLDAYDWEFCQIQYNYINTHYQAGTAGLQAAAQRGLPVIIMEPLLGGKLATGLPQNAALKFSSADSTLTPAAWGLRWLWNQKEVTVVLSGMNESSQLEENISIANDAVPEMLTTREADVFESVIKLFNASYKVACTGCNYCMPCPHKVNIPACFSAYNVSYTVGWISGIQLYFTSIGIMNALGNYAASRCKKCGACEKKCPQHLPIMASLGAVKKRMEPWWVMLAAAILRRIWK
jgi:predicted aldo/keto reductase-like oxidoreductase